MLQRVSTREEYSTPFLFEIWIRESKLHEKRINILPLYYKHCFVHEDKSFPQFENINLTTFIEKKRELLFCSYQIEHQHSLYGHQCAPRQ